MYGPFQKGSDYPNIDCGVYITLTTMLLIHGKCSLTHPINTLYFLIAALPCSMLHATHYVSCVAFRTRNKIPSLSDFVSTILLPLLAHLATTLLLTVSSISYNAHYSTKVESVETVIGDILCVPAELILTQVHSCSLPTFPSSSSMG